MTRRPRVAATAALVMLLLAGCAIGSGTRADTHQSAALTKAMKFSSCMRTNGVGEFPDPNASGSLTLQEVVNVSSLDPSAPAWKNAYKVCKDLQPAGFERR